MVALEVYGLWFMVYKIRFEADYSMDDRQQGDVQRLWATYCFLSFWFSNQIQSARKLTMSFVNLATHAISAGAHLQHQATSLWSKTHRSESGSGTSGGNDFTHCCVLLLKLLAKSSNLIWLKLSGTADLLLHLKSNPHETYVWFYLAKTMGSADPLAPAGGRESILRARDKKHILYFPAYFAETFNCLCAKTRKIKISIRGTRRQGSTTVWIQVQSLRQKVGRGVFQLSWTLGHQTTPRRPRKSWTQIQIDVNRKT